MQFWREVQSAVFDIIVRTGLHELFFEIIYYFFVNDFFSCVLS